MLERPDLSDEKIIACLQAAYGLHITHVEFLPLGVDVNAGVYRIVADNAMPYFLKARRGPFAEIAVLLPKLLHDQGISQIITPLPTQTGQLWASLDDFTLILYRFIDGHDGYTVELSDAHWREFGAALKRIHTATLPPTLVAQIPQERFASTWTERMRHLLAHLDSQPVTDATARELAAFLTSKTTLIRDLVARTEQLAQVLRAQPPAQIVCHTDLHAGNILIGVDGALYIVDWDAPLRAPKERDLMFAGGAQFGAKRRAEEEETLFYAGYGSTEVNHAALAYYRCVRIVEDLVLYCEDIFLTQTGGDDRAQALRYLQSNFQPDGTIEVAYQGDQTGAK